MTSQSSKACIFVRTGSTWTWQQDLAGSIGWMADISGRYAILGVPYDLDYGQAQIWVRNLTTQVWSLQTTISNSDGVVGDRFGWSVAIKNNYAVVGATNSQGSGQAYVFRNQGGAWLQQSILVPPGGAAGDEFGYSVGLTAMAGGRYDAIVGAPSNGTGLAYTFQSIEASGTPQGTPIAAPDATPGAQFGYSVAISTSSIGTHAVVGAVLANGIGQAYVFGLVGSTWQSQQVLTDPNSGEGHYGHAVAIEGRLIAVSAYNATYTFLYDGTGWLQLARLVQSDGQPGDFFGHDLTIAPLNNNLAQVLVGAPRAEGTGFYGAVYVFGPPPQFWWDQTSNPTGVVINSQQFEDTYDVYDNGAADDFTVWSGKALVSEIHVLGQYFNGSGPARSETVTFYKDNGGKPGSIIKQFTVIGTDDNGSFLLHLRKPVKLGPGHYWIGVVANMDFESGGQWGWATRSVQSATLAVWQNPADGFGTGCTTWSALERCFGADQGVDLAFSLH